MAKKSTPHKDESNSLPVLWLRSMFDLQSLVHANLQRMMPTFVPYPIKQREDECFRELHDGYQSFVIDLVSNWPKCTPWGPFSESSYKSDCDVINAATTKRKS